MDRRGIPRRTDLSLGVLYHGDDLVHPLLHLLGRLATRVLLARRTTIRPNPPVWLDLFDIGSDQTLVSTIVPFGDLGCDFKLVWGR